MQIRKIAAENCASLSVDPELQSCFKTGAGKPIKHLVNLTSGPEEIAVPALTALVNLSGDEEVCQYLTLDAFVYSLLLDIVVPGSKRAGLACMLLNNISKSPEIAKIFVDPTAEKRVAAAPAADGKPRPQYDLCQIDNLVEVFLRTDSMLQSQGQGAKETDYDHLAGLFGNISQTEVGAKFFSGNSKVDNEPRLSKLLPFLKHPSLVRRRGVTSVFVNTAFRPSTHDYLLNPELNFLSYILLPLCGDEDFSEEDMEGMPDDLQMLEPGNAREPDAGIRYLLVQQLLLLTQTRKGREILRANKVYPVIRQLHLWEQDEDVKDVIERLVNMLMRDEDDGKPQAVPKIEEITMAEAKAIDAPSTAASTEMAVEPAREP
ncbi:hypothetical protein CXG81DRAFT_15232 [Caulochytrium protostelioides]|uniref:Protein HGH1 homolog n=1 Tax=Caulochytrium protostelioides TaxID=1555241 RepID=A0A4P9X1D9_9FUNG|nr:hypothetical protein CXG81DRAFT_15232 [Caulochytrium protostelioides]|eukprot:RKO98952.1 hypothetical protein CXG81DRAFT_15232 [Caulochytrium protostelioides]